MWLAEKLRDAPCHLKFFLAITDYEQTLVYRAGARLTALPLQCQQFMACVCSVFLVYLMLCLIVFGCQYQCNRLSGKTRLRSDLLGLCVAWDVKLHSVVVLIDVAYMTSY